MEKRHTATRFALTLVAVAVLLPLLLTAVYSLCAPSEIKEYMGTRGNYNQEKGGKQ